MATKQTPADNNLAVPDDISFLDIYGDTLTGYENLDQSDFKLTRLKIVQNTSEEAGFEGVKMGEIYNSTTKRSYPSLLVTIANVSKSRVLWPDGKFKRGDSPICRSGDGKTGHFLPNDKKGCPKPGGGEYPCGICPFADWGPNKEKPPCNLAYSVLMVINEDQTPARMNFGGTSFSTFKDFINQCLQKSSSLGKAVPVNAFNIILSTTRESNEKGIYYVADLKFDPNSFINHPTRGKIEGVKAADEARQYRNLVEDVNNMFGAMMTSVSAVDEEAKFMGGAPEAPNTASAAANTEEGNLF